MDCDAAIVSFNSILFFKSLKKKDVSIKKSLLLGRFLRQEKIFFLIVTGGPIMLN